MKLRRLNIERLPGIPSGYALTLQGGVTVIEGPNESGKTSLCRAMRALLWPKDAPEGYVNARAEFEDAEGLLQVERDGPMHRWVREGEAVEAPPLPEGHLSGCFFLRLEELVDLASKHGEDVADEIRRQMAGGYDLKAVLDGTEGVDGSRFGGTERKTFERADRAAKEGQKAHKDTAKNEQRLADLKKRAQQARAAQQERTHLDKALELAELRRQLEGVKEELAQLPEALAGLNGEELNQLDQRLGELDAKARLRTELERDLELAGQQAADTNLSEPIEEPVLDTLFDKAEILRETKRKVEAAEKHLQGKVHQLQEAREQAGAEEGVKLDLGDGGDLLEFLSKAEDLRSRRVALEESLGALGTPDDAPDNAREDLEAGVRALRAWLRAPDASEATSDHPRRLARVLFGLAGLALVVGILVEFASPGSWQAPAGAALALVLAGAWLASRGSGASADAGAARRQQAKEDYPRTLDAPASWSVDEVAEHLRRMEVALTAQLAQEERGRSRDSLLANLQRLDEQEQALDRQRQALADQLGLGTVPADAKLVLFARRLDRLDMAALEERREAAELAALEDRCRQDLAVLAGELSALGEDPPQEVPAARPVVKHLRDRSEELLKARELERTTRRTLEQVQADTAEIEAIVQSLYASAGLEPGDRVGMERLLELHPAYETARQSRDGLERALVAGTGPLTLAKKQALLDLDATQLEAEGEKLDRLIHTGEELRDEIAAIEQEVKSAKAKTALEQCLAVRRDAQGALANKRDEALDGLATRFLIDRVRDRHGRDQAPEVLKITRSRFARFTGNYELEVAPDGAGSFWAIDTSTKQRRTPAQLSTGTRAQLMIAARLAFAETCERGSPLPIFLDEALDHSDPVRFEAIAGCLGEIAAQGRQVIYLTSDPSDVKLIERALTRAGHAPPHHIDLGEIRGMQQTVSDPAQLELPPLPTVPAPGGMTAEQYGVTVDVTPLEPRRGAAAQHLYYLLADNIEALHTLLQNRVRTVGHWQAVRRNNTALASKIEQALTAPPTLTKRAQLFEVFCESWSTGRGRPVDGEALADTEVLTERWLKPLTGMVADLGGDGQALLRTLRAKEDTRSKGLGGKTIETLEDALLDSGHLADEAVLDEDEVARRVLDCPAAEGVDAPRLTELVRGWWAHASR